MSQPRPDNAFRPSRTRTHNLSTPQLRALRKELLIVRASVERAELAASVVEVREAVTRFSWLRFLVPGFGAPTSTGGVGAGIGKLLKDYPLLSSIVSLVVAKPLRESVASAARPVVKWGGLALTVWEAWRIWQQVRGQRSASGGGARRYASEEEDTTG